MDEYAFMVYQEGDNQEGKIREDEKSEGNKKDPDTSIFYDRAERFVNVQEKENTCWIIKNIKMQILVTNGMGVLSEDLFYVGIHSNSSKIAMFSDESLSFQCP